MAFCTLLSLLILQLLCCVLMHFVVFLFVFSEIRAQLVEQQKCLDQQTEMRVQLLQDLQDFFRKKAEIEMEYSRNLEKLAERFMAKTRSTKDHQQYKWGDAASCCARLWRQLEWHSLSWRVLYVIYVPQCRRGMLISIESLNTKTKTTPCQF